MGELVAFGLEMCAWVEVGHAHAGIVGGVVVEGWTGVFRHGEDWVVFRA